MHVFYHIDVRAWCVYHTAVFFSYIFVLMGVHPYTVPLLAIYINFVPMGVHPHTVPNLPNQPLLDDPHE